MEPLIPQMVGLMMMCSAQVGAVFDKLNHHYAETPAAIGIAERSGHTMVLTRDDTVNWSVVMVSEEGACVAFSGVGWQDIYETEGYE